MNCQPTMVLCKCLTLKEAWLLSGGPETLIVGIVIGVIGLQIIQWYRRRK